MSLSSNLASFLRSGMPKTSALGKRPEQPLVLYEFEGCPFCRKVREAISALDLETEVRPCPRGGERFRAPVKADHPHATFPFLIDPNNDVEMFESADIVRYLYETYGDGKVPASLTSPLFVLSSQLASVVRGGAGAIVRPGAPPAVLPILEGRENDPVARLIREELCELEIAYVRRNADEVMLIDVANDRTISGDAASDYVKAHWRA